MGVNATVMFGIRVPNLDMLTKEEYNNLSNLDRFMVNLETCCSEFMDSSLHNPHTDSGEGVSLLLYRINVEPPMWKYFDGIYHTYFTFDMVKESLKELIYFSYNEGQSYLRLHNKRACQFKRNYEKDDDDRHSHSNYLRHLQTNNERWSQTRFNMSFDDILPFPYLAFFREFPLYRRPFRFNKTMPVETRWTTSKRDYEHHFDQPLFKLIQYRWFNTFIRYFRSGELGDLTLFKEALKELDKR